MEWVMFEDDYSGLNFWPAFADFMLALLLVFMIAFGIAHLTPMGVNVESAQNCQCVLEQRFRQVYGSNSAAGQQVLFRADPQNPFLLRIHFRDRLLFDEDDAVLKTAGERVLGSLAGIIRGQLASIRQIQVHGHADTRTSKKFKSNLHLAAERANSVFQFLKDHGIDPSRYAMSSTSYGEFFPVNRQLGAPWRWSDTQKENRTTEQRQSNRRVELLVFYGEQAQPCGDCTPKADTLKVKRELPRADTDSR
jgi:outer membrane protein OmpA-like peptidoglycan-associated protein